jgi:hypothetical protein
MIIHYMSASRIKKYMQCPESYHQSYEEGVKGGALHLTFGTMIHKVFERYYEEDRDIKEIYDEEWASTDIADLEYYRDGFEIIDSFLKMNDKERYALMGLELPFAIDIQSGKIFDTDSVDWGSQDSFRGFLKQLEEADAPIIFGYIDRVEYDMDNDILRIVDYKTSRVALSQDEADEDTQLSMYDLVASYLFPEYGRVIQELQYVRLGVPVRTSRTEKDRETFKKWLIGIFYKIRDDKVHKATLNRFCGWCDSRAGCHAYQELINGDADEFFTLDGMNDEDLDEQLEKINVHLKILDGRKKEIEGYMKEVLKRSDNAPMSVRGGERYLTNNMRTAYDPMTVLRLFPENAHELLSVNKTKVDEIAKGNRAFIEELEGSANRSFTAPTLRKKKSK